MEILRLSVYCRYTVKIYFVIELRGCLIQTMNNNLLKQLLMGSSKRPQSNISLVDCTGKFSVSSIVSQTDDIYVTCGRHIVSMRVGFRGDAESSDTLLGIKYLLDLIMFNSDRTT